MMPLLPLFCQETFLLSKTDQSYLNHSGGARGTRQDWHPPVQQQTYPAGTIVHPVASNIPGIAGPQPYAAPLQCPSTSAQEPGTSCAIEEPVSHFW